MTRHVVWMPTINTQLNPHVHGEWVDATPENKQEVARRWEQEHSDSSAADIKAAVNTPSRFYS